MTPDKDSRIPSTSASASDEFWSASDRSDLISELHGRTNSGANVVTAAELDLLASEVLSISDDSSPASLATPRFSDPPVQFESADQAGQAGSSQQIADEVDVVKQLDFDPVSLPADNAVDAPCLQHRKRTDHQVDADLLVVESDNDNSSSDEFFAAGTASAKPSRRRRAALDSDSDSEQGALLCTDNSTATGLQPAEVPSATRQKGKSAYDFSAYSSDEESCVEGSLQDRAFPAPTPRPAVGKQTVTSTRAELPWRSNDAIVLSSSPDDSQDSSVNLGADASELSSTDNDAEASDQANESADHVAAHMRHLQITPPRTAFKPIHLPQFVVQPQMPKSLPPKPKPNLPLLDPFSRVASGAAFKRQRDSLAADMFKEMNATVFHNKLPADLQIGWNKHLQTTAGLTHYSRHGSGRPARYSSKVELSTKVVDTPDKLQRTLCHELCHVATWLLDHVAKPPHGPHFKAWAAAAMKVYPYLDITTCHSYDIHFAWRWQCSNPECQHIFKRHSNSIDVDKQICSLCRGRLQSLGRFNPDGTPAKARAPSQYSLFVRDNFAVQKKECGPGTPHKDVMRALSVRWKARGSD